MPHARRADPTHTMQRTPRSTATAASLRRWLCAWLALLTALQVFGSAMAGVHGPLHRHRPAADSAARAAALPALRWQHDRESTPASQHQQLHARGEAHPHDLSDSSVVPVGAEPAIDAMAQLALAYAPAQHASALWTHSTTRHVWAAALTWAASSRSIAPLRKPPRG
jgi:hypothetical protein